LPWLTFESRRFVKSRFAHIAGVFFLLSGSLCAQRTDVRGTVVDSTNGEPIPSATILVKGTSRGASANLQGFFLIPSIPPGRYALVVSSVGYVTKEVPLVASYGETTVLTVKLAQKAVQMPEVVVEARPPGSLSQISTSFHVMNPQEVRAVPAAVQEDIFRAIQVLPGIVSTSDVSARFYVRGGAGDQNLILLNGMKIYNPYHAFGLFSVFDPDIVRSTEVFTGAFPAGFGGRLSSVVNMTTRDGNTNQLSGRGSVNFLSGKLQLEGPISSTLNGILDVRKSYSSRALHDFLNKDVPVSFYDGFFRVTNRFEESQARYGVQGFFSGDNLRSPQLDQPDYSWKNYAVGFTASGLILDRVFVNAVAYEDYFAGRRDAKASTVITPASTSVREPGLRANATLYTDSKDIYFFGFEFYFPTLTFDLVNNLGTERHLSTDLAEGWGWIRYQTDAKPWLVDVGLHLDLAGLLSGTTGLENLLPRINVSRPIFGSWRLKLSYGHFIQYVITVNNEDDVISIFDAWTSIPNDLPPERADHFIAGIEGNVFANLSLSVQTYYKYFTSLVNYNREKVSRFDPDYITARGDAAGIETMLRYAALRWDFYAAYSYSSASITSQGLTYPPRYDRTHTLNLLATFRPLKDLSVSLRWEFGSGFPYSQTLAFYNRLSFNDFFINPFQLEEGSPYAVLGPKNAARLPSYHRLDISANYSFPISSLKGSAGLSLINVYNRHNLFYFDRKTGQRINMLPFFPSASVSVEF
jgi:hypothetical protein